MNSLLYSNASMCFVRPDLLTSVNYLFCNSLEPIVGIVLRISVEFVLAVSYTHLDVYKRQRLYNWLASIITSSLDYDEADTS